MTASRATDARAEAQVLIVALSNALADDMTTAGHVAQKVSQEHLGGCSVKGCSQPCRDRWALIALTVAWINANVAEEPSVEQQPSLFEEALP